MPSAWIFWTRLRRAVPIPAVWGIYSANSQTANAKENDGELGVDSP